MKREESLGREMSETDYEHRTVYRAVEGTISVRLRREASETKKRDTANNGQQHNNSHKKVS